MNRTAIFDAVRRMVNRPFSQSDVDLLDAAITSAMRPDVPSEPERSNVPRKTSASGIALIHEYEQFRSKAYPDPGSKDGKPVTIGWGSTRDEMGKPIMLGDVWNKARADKVFAQQLEIYEKQVFRALGSSVDGTSQAQFDALVSFHYNTGAISSATLTQMHRAGNFKGAALQFRRWNKNDGRVMRGLVRRRAAEEKLYRSGM